MLSCTQRCHRALETSSKCHKFSTPGEDCWSSLINRGTEGQGDEATSVMLPGHGGKSLGRTSWPQAGWQYTALTYTFSYLKPVCCSLSSSNCCFLTCIQVSQEAGQVVWYSHLFQNFPQLIVTHTVKGFGIVNKAEIDVFLKLSCFFDNPVDVGNLISGS